MHNISNAFTTTLQATAPGDFVFVELRKARAPAVVFGKDARGTILGVLRGVDGASDAPFHIVLKNSSPCISYGGNWLFDYDTANSEFYAGNSTCTDLSGVVHLTDEGLILSISPMLKDHQSTAIDFNLSTKTIGSGAMNNLAPIGAWSAWESIEHRTMRDGRPVAQVIARAP